MPSREVESINKLGLHARAAAKLVTLATSFESTIQVARGDKQVPGNSIMAVMMLAAAKGTRLTITAEGSDAEQALDALEALVNNRFDEEQ